MSSKYEQTNHVVVKPWKATAPVKYERCQYITAQTWPNRCNAPSHGRTYCAECRNASMAAAPKFHGGLKQNRSAA